MLKLKTTPDLEQELLEKCIVVCTHIKISDQTEVNCIDIEYQDQYPELEAVDVMTGTSLLFANE